MSLQKLIFLGLFSFKIYYLEGRKVKDWNILISIYIAYLWKYSKIEIKVNQTPQRIIMKAIIPCFDLEDNFLFWNKQYTSYSFFTILLGVSLFISLSQIILMCKENI